MNLERKKLAKSVVGYVYFLMIVPFVLSLLWIFDNVVAFIDSNYSLFEFLIASWFPVLIIIGIYFLFSIIRRAGNHTVYSSIDEESLLFPSLAKPGAIGLPNFRAWPLAEINSVEKLTWNDAITRDQYNLKRGPTLKVAGTYWSIQIPAIGLGGLDNFIDELKARSASSKQDHGLPQRDVRTPEKSGEITFFANKNMIKREVICIVACSILAAIFVGMVVRYNSMIIEIIVQKAFIVVASKSVSAVKNDSILWFNTSNSNSFGKYIQAFDFPKEQIPLEAIERIEYSHFPSPRVVGDRVSLFMRSLLGSENVTLFVGESRYRFYNVFENGDHLLNALFDQAWSNHELKR